MDRIKRKRKLKLKIQLKLKIKIKNKKKKNKREPPFEGPENARSDKWLRCHRSDEGGERNAS